MMLFDSHSHLYDAKFHADWDDVVAKATASGVGAVLVLGDTIQHSREAIALAQREPVILAAAGIHPSNARCWDDEVEAMLVELLRDPMVAVLGEIGLDYYWDTSADFVAIQQTAFRRQLQIAREHDLAVSIHSREANRDVLRLLKEEHAERIGGVLHCFHGSYEEARTALDLGFYLGVGGSSTYPKSADHRELLKRIGTDRLLLETDAPYLPPQPHRGKRNESAFVADTCRIIAASLGMEPEALAARCWQNTVDCFRLAHRPAYLKLPRTP